MSTNITQIFWYCLIWLHPTVWLCPLQQALALLCQLNLSLLQAAASLLQWRVELRFRIWDLSINKASIQLCFTILTSIVLNSEAPSLQSFSSLAFSTVNPAISKARYTFSIVNFAFSYRWWEDGGKVNAQKKNAALHSGSANIWIVNSDIRSLKGLYLSTIKK